MNAELPPLPVIFEDENGDQDGAAYTSAEMNRYAEVAAARERILLARIAELEADALPFSEPDFAAGYRHILSCRALILGVARGPSEFHVVNRTLEILAAIDAAREAE